MKMLTIILMLSFASLAVGQGIDSDIPDIFTGGTGPVVHTLVCDDAGAGGKEELTITWRKPGSKKIEKIEVEVDIPAGTGVKAKAQLIADAIEDESEETEIDKGTGLKDPLSVVANIRSISIEADPDKGCSLTPVMRWKSGSGEKHNRSRKGYNFNANPDVTYGVKFKGSIDGMNSAGQPSVMLFGVLGQIRTLDLYPGDDLAVRMDELYDFITGLGLDARRGVDPEGGEWIVFCCGDAFRFHFGSDDLGFTTTRGGSVELASDLVGFQQVKFLNLADNFIGITNPR